MKIRDLAAWQCPACGFQTMISTRRTCPECGRTGDWIQPGERLTYEEKKIRGVLPEEAKS